MANIGAINLYTARLPWSLKLLRNSLNNFLPVCVNWSYTWLFLILWFISIWYGNWVDILGCIEHFELQFETEWTSFGCLVSAWYLLLLNDRIFLNSLCLISYQIFALILFRFCLKIKVIFNYDKLNKLKLYFAIFGKHSILVVNHFTVFVFNWI